MQNNNVPLMAGIIVVAAIAIYFGVGFSFKGSIHF